MSIKMDNTVTPLEKADAIANLIEQMYLANAIKDSTNFKRSYTQASKLAFELVNLLYENK